MTRLYFLFVTLFCLFIIILSRLYYWQIFKREHLTMQALSQYQKQILTTGSRGTIHTQDSYPLVVNEKVYRLFVEPHLLDKPQNQVSDLILPILLNNYEPYLEASDSAKTMARAELSASLSSKLANQNQKWISLFSQIDEESKKNIESLKISGLGFDEYEVRSYPQASMAAHLLGFVGKNSDGEDTGYFGIEGGLDQELRGERSTKTWYKNIFSFIKNDQEIAQNGRDVILTIRRDIQFLAEDELKRGVERYGAKSGEVVIIEPTTGKILAMATFPTYHPQSFYKYDTSLYKNPSVSDTFEPGSIFKVLTLAAGLDAGVITPETTCPNCSGPVKIGKYTIKTWNEQYHPNINMTDAIAKSDNTAMIFIANLLGSEKFKTYIKNFGISLATTTDLEEDKDTPFPTKWGEIELATRSFGQGITTTSLQMVRAVGAIANNGKLMSLMIVDRVKEPETGREIISSPKEIRSVISPESAKKTTEIMVNAASAGEAKWTAKYQGIVAGKTGTAQIALEGSYDEQKTVASFIGFAPQDNPKFVMIVKLVEPQSSPWASETAAPLWYKIADSLFLLLNIPTANQAKQGN